MKTRKTLALFLSLSLLLTATFVMAQEDSISLVKYLDEFSRALYENKDIGTTHNLAQYIEGDSFYAYLSEKVAVHQLITKRAFLYKTSYRVETEPRVIEALNRETYFVSLAVRVNFNYVGMSDVNSGYGELMNLVVSNQNGDIKVLDAFAPLSYYDTELRGAQYDLKHQVMQNPQLLTKSYIADRAKEMKDRLDHYYDTLYEELEGLQPNDSAIDSVTVTSTLNKSAITAYTREYCTYVSPHSGGSGVPYYDFSQLGGDNWDCTNFVSHSLLAGGAMPYNNGNPATGWYYVNLSNRSYSWSSVRYLFEYLTRSSTTPGPYGTSIAYYAFDERYGYPYSMGDILQHYNGAVWRHSTVITGVYEYFPGNPYYLGALVCGRSAVGAYNKDQKAEEIYPGQQKRVIRLAGIR